ncbi:division/cell wall cluster transcriptional repressor MraZ [Pseudoclavibacter caeni]|jgi:MraZ protein|uniref:Transcriptional regulator MraZ n=1 Tax=Pseudoclavibacter caeni TaxID=908846 RepID=A0A7C8FUP1_9MICO|nr:division/cell wall cluster transcriptional repressor MraZ [Pseudoclavibacter caeni]KAB1632989.1 division/cell wall cluster transcriptional repressor MraZ [Pseudoclavibacter caeni]NYJ97035.1 MraZ protein [Pseudoclavibacter caeni]
MFLGTHSPRMDDKGRLVLPAKFREELADGVVLTRGQEHCLYVFGAQEFRRIHEAIRQAPLTSRQARDFLRLFLSGASDQVPDRQGRITVPPDLRRYAGLTRDLVVIGTGDRAEIWDAAAWSSYLEANEEPFSETAEEVIPGVF